jgi:hypothetical protein
MRFVAAVAAVADKPYEFLTQTDHCHIGYRYNGALDDPGLVAMMPPQGYIFSFSGPNPHTLVDIGGGHLLSSVAFSCNAGPYQKIP